MLSIPTVSAGFEPVAERFDEIVAALPSGGAAVAAFVDGQCVLNRWGGEARTGQPWTADTLTTIFSCTKGLSAIVVAMLVERGVLDPGRTVAFYWPAFASVSNRLTVRELLEHRAGLSAVRRDMTLDEVLDHDTVIAELLSQGPLWEPGTDYAYHSFTFGTLLDELLRQATGTSLAVWFRELVAEPLDVDTWIGIPANAESRMTELSAASSFALPDDPALHPHPMEQRAGSFGTALPIETAFLPGEGFNRAELHHASLPGVNAASGAFGLAKIWSAVVTETDGTRLLSDDSVNVMREVRVTGAPVWGGTGTWWNRGFGVMLNTDGAPATLGAGSFGHDGLGGQIGWANPELGVSFAYVSNALYAGEQQCVRWSELATAFVEACG